MGFSSFFFSCPSALSLIRFPIFQDSPGQPKEAGMGTRMSKVEVHSAQTRHPSCSEAVSQAHKCPCDRVSGPFCYYSPNGHLRMSVLDEVFGDGRGELGFPFRPTYEGLIDG